MFISKKRLKNIESDLISLSCIQDSLKTEFGKRIGNLNIAVGELKEIAVTKQELANLELALEELHDTVNLLAEAILGQVALTEALLERNPLNGKSSGRKR